jgi:hypothetical protein
MAHFAVGHRFVKCAAPGASAAIDRPPSPCSASQARPIVAASAPIDLGGQPIRAHVQALRCLEEPLGLGH